MCTYDVFALYRNRFAMTLFQFAGNTYLTVPV